MNVLVCSAARFGIANVVYNVLEKMEPLDVEITYCRNPLNPSPEWCETIDLLDKKQYKRIASVLKKTPIYRPIHLFYGILWYWRNAFNYIEHHNDEYDVIWLHSPHPLVANRYLNNLDNIVVTIHSRPKQHLDREGADSIYYRLLHDRQLSMIAQPCVKLVTGAGPDIVSELRESSTAAKKIKHVGNGVNVKRYTPVEPSTNPLAAFDIPSDHTVVLYLSRFTEAKQPRKSVDVFEKMKAQQEDLTLIMAGEGELLQKTQQAVATQEIDDVYFPGYVSGEYKRELYRAADLFLLSSKYEGGHPPLVLAEAMATGIPTIISQIEASEFVIKADCGIVVNFDAPSEAAEEILFFNNQLSECYRMNAREYAVANFAWESIANKYLELFHTTT